ncbi:MAG: TldD/PmbA family protein [Oscillospiraceae bacterium]|nr:TldD/PmbA family protein [Oscillospiraceae bacterium]
MEMEKLKEIALYALDRLKEEGADEAQSSVSEGRTEEFNVDAGEFSLIRSVFSSSISLKAIKDRKKGSTAINSLQKNEIDEAARECVKAAISGTKDEGVCIAEKETNLDFKDGALSCSKEKFFDSIIKFTEDVKREYPQIMLEQLIANYSYGKHVFANSNGVLFSEEDGSYSISVSYSAHDGEKTTSFNYFDIETLDPEADIMELGMTRVMFERAIAELNAEPFYGKFVGTAVLSPMCLTELISVIAGSFCGDIALIEGTSPWKNSLGKKVASDNFTLSVIPNDDRIICGENITAEGYKSENYDIIKDGVLNSFCLTQYGANRTGLKRAASTSGCVEVKAGNESLNEIISKIEKGILVCRFSGGEPASNGDFSGVAKNSFLIENGKISHPLTETMISGNFADMVKKVEGISSETLQDGSCVLPYAAFGGVTVSGGTGA